MKVIDGKNATLGRLASYTAKEALKGEDIRIVNCEEIIITGSKKNIKEDLKQKRGRVGTIQKGPKISMASEKLVKRAIRGMLPNHRFGRGREAYQRIKCYVGFPKEFENSNLIKSGKEKKGKFVKIKEISK